MQQLGAFDEGVIKRKNTTTVREGGGPGKFFWMRHRAISYVDRSFLNLANQ